MIRTLVILVIAFISMGTKSLGAEITTEGEIVSDEGGSSSFETLTPDADEFDWIRLTSGEWLKGEIVELRNEILEFESDKLDTLMLDWNDVAFLRSPKSNSVLFEEKITATGTLLIQDGTVVIGGKEYDRALLLAIIPGDPKERNFWSGKLSLGLDGRAGNTDQKDATAYFMTVRRTTFSRLHLDYNGAFGKQEGKQITNNHLANGKFDVFMTRRLFLTPLFVEYYRDPFQNIAYRVLPGAGLGYIVIDRKEMEWDLSLGGGYRYTRFDSVLPGEDKEDATYAVIVGTKFSTDLTNNIDFLLNYNVQIGFPASDGTNHHLMTRLSYEFSDLFDLDFTFTWDRVGKPVEDSSGVPPEKDDFRLSVGLGIDF